MSEKEVCRPTRRMDNELITSIHLAAKKGDVKRLKCEIENIPKKILDEKCNNGHTALWLAAKNGHQNFIEELLLRSKADVNIPSIIGNWTILHYACRKNWINIVKLLVNKKETKLNALTTLNMTPMLLAAYEGRPHLVEILIEAGADVNCKDSEGCTVLHYASQKGWLHIVKKIVIEGGNTSNIDKLNFDKMTPVMLAAKGGHADMLQILVDAGGYVNCRDSNMWTPIHHACQKGMLPIVKKLINVKICDINARTPEGNTPLHLAWNRHYEEIVRELIKAGADITISNDDELYFNGKTKPPPFKDVRELQYLISIGLSLEMRDHMGYTALHRAAENNDIKCAEFLIRNQCEIDARADGNETPLLLAAFQDKPRMVQLLLNSGANVNCRADWTKTTVLHTAIKSRWTNIVEDILKIKNVRINAKTDYGWTPLMYAVDTSQPTVAKLLLEAGANVHGCDDDGETPLHLACNQEIPNIELIEMLLQAGANPNLKNADSETPLHYAVEQESLCLEVIKLLIEHGAYFRYSFDSKITWHPVIKKLILSNVDLSTQLVINKFNGVSLPQVYLNPKFVDELPRMEMLYVNKQTVGVRQGIEDCVRAEITAKTFCNVMKAQPIVLKLMCVEALIRPPAPKTKEVFPRDLKVKGPIKRAAPTTLGGVIQKKYFFRQISL